MPVNSFEIDEANPPRSQRRRGRRKWALIGIGALGIGGAGVSLGLATAGYFYTASPTVRRIVQAVRRQEITPDRAFPGKDSLTLLIVGADQDRDNYKRVVGRGQRSDALMVARLDFLGRTASVVSIPRDTRIHIPGYRGYQKINAAYAYGRGDLCKQVVEGLLGVTIDDVVALNFDGFKRVIDLLGGVPVHVDKPLNYDDNWGDLHVHLEPGDHWLNGQQALGFVRIRKVDSDLHRTERQQQFVRALRGRFSDPRVWLRGPALIEAARSAIDTPLDDNQLLCLASFIKGLPPEAIRTETLPGDEGPSFVTLYPDKVKQVARELLAVEDAPLEGLGSRYDGVRLASGDYYGARLASGDYAEGLGADGYSRLRLSARARRDARRRARARSSAAESAAWDRGGDEFSAPLSQKSDGPDSHGDSSDSRSGAKAPAPAGGPSSSPDEAPAQASDPPAQTSDGRARDASPQAPPASDASPHRTAGSPASAPAASDASSPSGTP